MFRALCHALYCTKMTSSRQTPRVYVHYFAHSPLGTCRAEAHPDADDRVRAATTSEIEGPLRLLKPQRSSASLSSDRQGESTGSSSTSKTSTAAPAIRCSREAEIGGTLVGPLGLFLTFAERDKELNAVIVQLIERKVAVAFAFFAVQLGALHRMLSCRVFSHDLY
jgi:hypothetical protein